MSSPIWEIRLKKCKAYFEPHCMYRKKLKTTCINWMEVFGDLRPVWDVNIIIILISAYVMWYEKNRHMVHWYHVKVWNITFIELFTWLSDTSIKCYYCSKAIKNKEKHKNCAVIFLYFAVSIFATGDRFSQITLHIIIRCTK